MPVAFLQNLRLIRDTAQRKVLTNDWDLDAIFNREIYPALKALRLALIDTNKMLVFNLSGAALTLLVEHIHNYIRLDCGEPGTLTVPNDATGGFEEGDWVIGIRSGGAPVTITAGTGVTINFPVGLALSTQWFSFRLINVGSSTWDFYGDAT